MVAPFPSSMVFGDATERARRCKPTGGVNIHERRKDLHGVS